MGLSTVLFGLIIGFLSLDFVIERILFVLNKSSWVAKMPKEFEVVYNEESYTKARNYAHDRGKVSNISSWVNFALILVVLFSGVIGWFDRWVMQIADSEIIAAFLFFGIAGFVSSFISLPFGIYSTFVVEEKYGFNKTTPKLFIVDLIKSWLLSAVLGGGIMALIIFIYEKTGSLFWLFAWLVVVAFMVFFSMFYSVLIVPLFNKQKPLEEGELKTAITDFAKKVGFVANKIFVIDGSKRSSKANAYFTGFGKQKRIVLYDTLINDHPTEELVAVLAHEVGHNKLKHTIVGLITGIIQTGLMFYILSLFISPDAATFKAVGDIFGTQPSFHVGVLVFGLLYSPLSLILSLIMNSISRKNEYAADRFSADNYNPKALGDALIKLSANNLSNLRPHPSNVFFYYSHPTLLQRLEALNYAQLTSEKE